MRIKEEKQVEKEWRQQKEWETRRKENRERAVQKRKCFSCGGWEHIARNCNARKGKKIAIQQSLNRFRVLTSKVMNVGVPSRGDVKKDRNTILRKEKKPGSSLTSAKGRKIEVRKMKDKRELLREVMVKIGLE